MSFQADGYVDESVDLRLVQILNDIEIGRNGGEDEIGNSISFLNAAVFYENLNDIWRQNPSIAGEVELELSIVVLGT